MSRRTYPNLSPRASLACVSPLAFWLASLLVFLFALSGHALASMDDEATFAGETVRDAVLKLDQADPLERRSILRKAVEAIAVLEGLSTDDLANETAKRTLAELQTQAITPDVLRLRLVEAAATGIAAGEKGLKSDVESKAVLEDIRDPAYRAAAWIQIARAHMRISEEAEAERLVMRAIEDARAIDRKSTRDGTLGAAILVFPFDGKRDWLVEAATNAMVTAAARSEIYRTQAVASLPGKIEKLSRDELSQAARQSLDAGDLPQSLQLTRAMEKDDRRRNELLGNLLDAALGGNDDALGLQVIKSMAKDREQDKGLRRLVDLRLKRDKPIRAQELTTLMLTRDGRIDAEIAIAGAYGRQGYQQAALDILNALDVSALEDPDAAADLVSGLAGLSAFDRAQTIAASIMDPRRRSFAYSRLSKRLADDLLIDDARTALAQVTELQDLNYARAGFARALIKAGKLDEARVIGESLPAGPDRDRVLEDLAKRHADAGDIDRVKDDLHVIDTVAGRVRVLIALATAPDMPLSDTKSVLAQAEELLSEAPNAMDEQAELAIAYAGFGDLGRADAMLDSVGDLAIRDPAEARIVGDLVLNGALDRAGRRLDRLSPLKRPAAVAELAIARFYLGQDLEAFIEAIRDLPFQVRVPALKTVARAQAGRLDSQQWLVKPDISPLGPLNAAASAQKANFMVGRHVVQAPVPSPRSLGTIAMPDLFSLDRGTMRARVKAPIGGVAHLALLGFNPLSLEAFKLTSGGTTASHDLQVSQQTTWPYYIAIEKGVVTLGGLLRDLPETTARGLLVPDGETLLVRVPIIVLPDATLLISGSEFSQYRLGAQSGTFIAVAGKLVVQDADIVGYDELAGQPAIMAAAKDASIFRPFITGWGGSDMQIAGSRLAALGYDSTKAFGLTQSSGAAIQSLYSTEDSRPAGNIVENSFENLRYGYYSFEASGVKLIGNEYRDNIVYGIDPHDRSDNLLIGFNTAYGTHEKHGITMSRGVSDSFVIGNLSIGNRGSGIMLDRTSSRNVVYANTALSNRGDGLTLYESACNFAAANEFTGNLRAGIKVRNSTDIGIYDNRLGNNGTSGADIYISDLKSSAEGRSRNFQLDPYEPVSTAVISGNLFVANGRAINVNGAAQTVLEANRFRDQRSNIYGGDLRPLSPFLLQLAETAATSVGTTCQPASAVAACPFTRWRLAPEHTPEHAMACTGVSQPLTTESKAKQDNG